ncbi:MAG: hypothetical protein SGBAC_011197 [Bacillariaceae sp.]
MGPLQISLDVQSHEEDHTFPTSSEASPVSTSPSERSIQFKDAEQVHLILCLDDYTEDEYSACWYSTKEYTKIEKSMAKQCNKMARGIVLKDEKFCSRGLEKYQVCNFIARKENSRTAMQSVLYEQERQDESQVYDDESIAQVYHNVSSSCQMWATVVGLRDQKEAERYIDDGDDDDDSENVTTILAQQPPTHTICTAKEKSPISNKMRSMSQPMQVAVSARTA